MSVQWTNKEYPMNALNEVARAQKALAESVDVHFIVMPAELTVSLPFPLQDWLERWVGLRQIEDAALAVINDAVEAGAMKTVSPELSRFVWKHGLRLITDAGTTEVNGCEGPVYLSRERELGRPVPQMPVAYAATRNSF